jgi:hypothetical protein
VASPGKECLPNPLFSFGFVYNTEEMQYNITLQIGFLDLRSQVSSTGNVVRAIEKLYERSKETHRGPQCGLTPPKLISNLRNPGTKQKFKLPIKTIGKRVILCVCMYTHKVSETLVPEPISFQVEIVIAKRKSVNRQLVIKFWQN